MCKHCENCGWYDRRVWCCDHTDKMPCSMALRVTGEPCPWWKSEPIITQDAAHALLAALENEIAELVHQGVVPSDETLQAIADVKGQLDD